MSKLIINGRDHGPVLKYEQDREKMEWVFRTTEGLEIRLPFRRIKDFSSSGDLEIRTA